MKRRKRKLFSTFIAVIRSNKRRNPIHSREINELMNANDFFKEYTGTENYYKHFSGLVYTDGVRALCIACECYWLLDVIGSYQRSLQTQEFQVWKLTKNADNTAVITCGDGNGNIIVGQRIAYTDFKYDMATIWVENNVILLPSEH